jgi:hypothetical protein
MLQSPIVALAKQRGWKVVTFVHSSCPFSTAVPVLETRGQLQCDVPNEKTMRALEKLRPTAVVTSLLASTAFDKDSMGDRSGVPELAATWRHLESRGISIYAVVDAPRPRSDVLECVSTHATDPDACKVRRVAALDGHDEIAKAAALAPGTHVVDFTDRYCSNQFCYPVIGNVAVYGDPNHITDTFARSLQSAFAAALPTALGSKTAE